MLPFHRQPDSQLRIGCWLFQRRSGEMSCNCATRRLEPIVAEVLELLISYAGEVVTREEILDQVWSHRVVVDESITRAISAIRRAFGDTQRPHRYVETLPKRGYRLIAPVSELQPDCAPRARPCMRGEVPAASRESS